MTFHFTGTSIKSGEDKLVLWTSLICEMMLSCKCFQHVSKMSLLSYNRAESVVIKDAIILNIIHVHNIFHLRDTDS